MLKLKEEFDYKSLSRRLDIQLDKLIAEHERQQKAFKDEIERITVEAQNQISEVERNYADSLEVNISIKYYAQCQNISLACVFFSLSVYICKSERALKGWHKSAYYCTCLYGFEKHALLI